MTKFLQWAALATAEERWAFLHDYRDHLSEFGDGPISILDFNGMIGLLAGTAKVSPKLLRVAAPGARSHVLVELSTLACCEDVPPELQADEQRVAR